MTYEDLKRQCVMREEIPLYEGTQILRNIITEYMVTSFEPLPYYNGNDYYSMLFYNYYLLYDTPAGKYLQSIMEKYNFNYSNSIHNALYNLLGKQEDLKNRGFNPLWWPGINSIEVKNSCYQVDSIHGTIRVYKASEVFANTSFAPIFEKALVHNCYSRTEDYAKLDKDCEVVLSYLPNFFYGGHYHAYVKKEDRVLDIAANAYYPFKEDSEIVFRGDILYQGTYEGLEDTYYSLEKEIPILKDDQGDKLHVLSLYYDYEKTKAI